MENLKKLFLGAKNFLFPADCALCGCLLTEAYEIKNGLCQDCAGSLSPVQGDKCKLCGKPLISEKETCLQCRNAAERSYERLWVLFPYTGKYRSLLKEYKFNKKPAIANFFAEKVCDVISSASELKDARIVPVPPRPGKIKEKGWDQVDTLVRQLEKKAGKSICVKRCLKRQKSQIQKRLSREERMENMKGSIKICGTAPKTALIIDDVITTGSTMEACSATLKSAGTEKVYGLCLFYD